MKQHARQLHLKTKLSTHSSWWYTTVPGLTLLSQRIEIELNPSMHPLTTLLILYRLRAVEPVPDNRSRGSIPVKVTSLSQGPHKLLSDMHWYLNIFRTPICMCLDQGEEVGLQIQVEHLKSKQKWNQEPPSCDATALTAVSSWNRTIHITILLQ